MTQTISFFTPDMFSTLSTCSKDTMYYVVAFGKATDNTLCLWTNGTTLATGAFKTALIESEYGRTCDKNLDCLDTPKEGVEGLDFKRVLEVVGNAQIEIDRAVAVAKDSNNERVYYFVNKEDADRLARNIATEHPNAVVHRFD